MQSYDKIYVGGKTGLLALGKFKLSDAGVGWKSQSSGEIVTIPSGEIVKLFWKRVARDFQLKIVKKNGIYLLMFRYRDL
jgi:structure-specific recognition protein 1